jgi:hypothetical protein
MSGPEAGGFAATQAKAPPGEKRGSLKEAEMGTNLDASIVRRARLSKVQ